MEGQKGNLRDHSKVDSVPTLTTSESEQGLNRFNKTSIQYPQDRLIHEFFEAQVERTPEAVAVVCGNRQVTYAELNCRANQMANVLVARGIAHNERVGVYVERSVEMVVCQLGILKAGGAYVPMDVSYPAGRLAYILEDSAPVVLLTMERLKRTLPQNKTCLIAVDADEYEIGSAPDGNLDAPRLRLTPQHLAYVIYTSGSTGAPKGVMVSHRNVANLVSWHCTTFSLSEGCRCSSVAALGFDATVWETWPPLSIGATLVLASPAVAGDTEALLFWWANEPLDVSFLPTPIAELAFSQNIFNARLRTLLVGGDRLRRHPGSKVPLVCNNYGPTEATVVATSGSLHDGDAVLHIGRPIANTQIYVLDDDRRPAPIGATGEIYIGGAGIARGYLNQPELTAERFIADPFSSDRQARMYRSGDLGRWQRDGTIEYLGRNDHQVKIHGFRIEPGEIEAQLLRYSEVKDAVVLAREDVPGEKRLVAYVVANLSQLNGLQQKGSDGAGAEMVAQWRTLYEETYSEGVTGPSFVGWNSSYTGQPLPEEQMLEWRNGTVERIRTLSPGKVLEIGCGVGLLLEHLAPNCEVYRGTDFSFEALHRLRKWLGTRAELQHVQLEQCSAHEIQGPPGTYDTVILNSVAQHFPDIEYLLAVLRRAVSLVSCGGHIFVGDVRHMGLLKLFHGSVQLERAADGLSGEQLKSRAARAMELEKELVIDPRFFSELPQHINEICRVTTLLKRAKSDNELTRYRYDVVLEVGELKKSIEQERLDWKVGEMSVTDCAASVRARNLRSVLICGVPNRRLSYDIAAWKLIDRSESSCTAGKFREVLIRETTEGEDPEAFWRAGEARGYEVQVGWSLGSEDGHFDVEWIDPTSAGGFAGAKADDLQTKPSISTKMQRAAYANDPLGRNLQRQLIQRLREYLKERLPPFMTPSAIVVLQELPLTPNGKLDRDALPRPLFGTFSTGEFEAPRGGVEDALADIWQELLQVDQVGRDDNFFELGGNSMTAMKLIVNVSEKFGIQLHVHAVFRNSKFSKMANLVEGLLSERRYR